MKSPSDHSASVVTAAVSDCAKVKSDAEFKMEGFENLDEDGIEIVDKTYPRYVDVNARGKRDVQVRPCKL